MTTQQTSISISYHPEADRLHLLFNDKEQCQWVCVLTRRLLKSLVSQLPSWMSVQARAGGSNTAIEPVAATAAKQEPILGQFQHEEVLQQLNNAPELAIKQNPELFLIETIKLSTLTVVEGKRIEMLLIGKKTAPHQSRLLLSTTQLHQLLAAMLAKVADWDLTNPWVLQADLTMAVIKDSATVIH